MVPKATKSPENSKAKATTDFSQEAKDMRDSALKFLGAAEKTGEKLTGEVRNLLEQLADNLASVASVAAETTASVTEKVTGIDTSEHLLRMVNEVKEASETSMRAIVEGCDALRQQVMDLAPPLEKSSITKKVAKKKVTEKKAPKKKPSVKSSAKRKPSKKRATRGKVAKKKPVVKKVAKKKTAKN